MGGEHNQPVSPHPAPEAHAPEAKPAHAPTHALPRQRAIVAFIAFALGLFIGRELEGLAPSVLWFSIAFALLAACVALNSRRTVGALLSLCACIIGIGWFTLRIHERAHPGPTFQQGVVEVEGTVLGAPRWREGDPITSRASGWWRFDVSLDRIAVATDASGNTTWKPLAGVVWVRQTSSGARDAPALRNQPPDIRAGSSVRLSGFFEAIDPPGNPGESDLRLLAAQRGVIGSIRTIPSAVTQIQPPTGPKGLALNAIAMLRARAADVVHRAAGAPDPHAPSSPVDDARASQRRSLISGLLLGEYDPQERDVRDAFARQGLVHILSISGFHLTVLAALTLVLIRLLGDHGRLEFLAVAAIIATFMLVVPMQSPIMRSGVLVLAILLVEATGRRYDRVTVLIWIAIALLLWRPLDLWSIGYQLSTGLTAALLWKAEGFHHRLWRSWITPELKGIRPVDRGLFGHLLDGLRASISTSLLCALLAAPVVATHAGLTSSLSVLVGVVVTPVVVLALWIGYVALMVGMVFPPAAGLASGVLGALAEGAIRMVEFFDLLPMSSWRLPPIPWTWALATTIALAWFVAKRRASSTVLVLLAVLMSWLVIAWMPPDVRDRMAERWSSSPRVVLRVDAFSVGDASCLLVRSGGNAMIWDAGAPRSSGVLPPAVEWARALGAWDVRTLVLTHADVDHYAAADTLVAPLDVRTLRISPAMQAQWDEDTKAQIREGRRTPLERVMSRAETALARHGGTITLTRRDDAWRMGHAQVRVLWPPIGFDPRAHGAPDNDASLAALIEVTTDAGPRRVVLTGDMTDRALSTLRELEPNLRADVMEAPHHGTTTPGVLAWIHRVNPSIVLQSAAERKSSDRSLDVVRHGRTWHATGLTGHAWVEIMSDGSMRTSTHRGPAR